MSKTQTRLIFCRTRKRSVPFSDSLVADYKTIRKVPVQRATQHAVPREPNPTSSSTISKPWGRITPLGLPDHPIAAWFRALHRPERLPHHNRPLHRPLLSRMRQWGPPLHLPLVLVWRHVQRLSSLGTCGTDLSWQPASSSPYLPSPLSLPFLPLPRWSHLLPPLSVGPLEDSDWVRGKPATTTARSDSQR